jgi:hypothetical protein
MCDAMTMLLGAGPAKVMSNQGGGSSSPDPAAERAAAEARAAQSANARIAATQRRRQQSLLSSGAPATDQGTASRSTTSLMGRAQMGGGSGQVIL